MPATASADQSSQGQKQHPGLVVVGSDYLFDSALNWFFRLSRYCPATSPLPKMMRLRRSYESGGCTLALSRQDRRLFLLEMLRGLDLYGKIQNRYFFSDRLRPSRPRSCWTRAGIFPGVLMAISAGGELVGACAQTGSKTWASRTTSESAASKPGELKKLHASSARSTTCRSWTRNSVSCSRPCENLCRRKPVSSAIFELDGIAVEVNLVFVR